MFTVGRLKAKNTFTFPQLDVNFDQSGMNLILGVNLDDVTGNNSRNGVGKSNLLRSMEVSLWSTASGFKRSDFMMDSASRDNFTCLEIIPHGQPVHYCYQYQKFYNSDTEEDWGSGYSIYQGGTYEDYSAGVTGVKDVSPDGSLEASYAVSALAGISLDEWRVLASLLEPDNDAMDPFFDSKRANRLELIQNMFGMNYSAILEQNQLELKALTSRQNDLSVGLTASLQVINSQLEALPPMETLEADIERISSQKTALEAESAEVAGKIAPLANVAELIDRWNALDAVFGPIKAAGRDIAAELTNSSQAIEDIQRYLSETNQQRIALEKYLETVQLIEDTELSIGKLGAAYLTMTNEECIRKSTELDGQQKRADHFKKVVAQYKSFLEFFIQQNVAIGNTTDLQLQATAYQGYAATASMEVAGLDERIQLLNQKLDADSQLHRLVAQYDEAFAAFVAIWCYEEVDPNQIGTPGFEEYVDGQIQANNNERSKIKHAIDSLTKDIDAFKAALESNDGGKCSSCGSELNSEHIQAEIANKELQRASLQNQLDDLQASWDKQSPVVAAMDNLYRNFIGRFEAGTTVKAIDARMAEAKAELATLSATRLEKNNLVTSYQSSAATFTNLSQMAEQDYAIVLEYVKGERQFDTDHTQEIATLDSAAALLRERQALESTKLSLCDQLDQFDLSDAAHELRSLKADIEQHKAALPGHQQYVKWATDSLGDWREYNSAKFANISEVSSGASSKVLEELRARQSRIASELASLQMQYGDVNGRVVQRKELEAKKAEIGEQATDLERIEKMIRVKSAVSYLAGPKGLIVSKTERLFDRLNTLMNFYLGRMVQDGHGTDHGAKLTAWLMMSNTTVELEVYRGEKNVSKATLSRSEKARVKLARTLAFRELCPPSKLPNLLLLDELDGSSCEVNKARIFDAVRMHVERVPQTAVWAISHSNEVQTQRYWTKVFQVVKESAQARLEVVK